MPADPDGPSLPQTALSEAPLTELISRAIRVSDTSSLLKERAELVIEFRRREMSWREIEKHTGWPHSNARRWLALYLDKDE